MTLILGVYNVVNVFNLADHALNYYNIITFYRQIWFNYLVIILFKKGISMINLSKEMAKAWREMSLDAKMVGFTIIIL